MAACWAAAPEILETIRDPVAPSADIVISVGARGAAVFAAGSVTWTGGLSHDRYRNDISVVTANVLRRVGDARANDSAARALAGSLGEAGVEIVYLGPGASGRRIAASAADAGADAVDVCVAGSGGVAVLRELLRELTRLGRREVSIVIHRLR